MYEVIKASQNGASLTIEFWDKYDMVAFFRTLKDKKMIAEDTDLYHGDRVINFNHKGVESHG